MEHEQLRLILQKSETRQPILGGESEQLRQQVLASAGLSSIVDEIRREAEALLKEPTPELSYSIFRLYRDTGTRKEYERAYFRRRKKLTTFGIMAWLEPKHAHFQEALCDILWSICDEYTWCLPAHLDRGPEVDETLERSLHSASNEVNKASSASDVTIDLFAAETAFTLSELAHLHSDTLPVLVRKRINEEVIRRVLRPFVNREHPYHWERATHNWAAVCAGSVGAAALYTLENSHQLAAVLTRVLPAMDSYLCGFSEDGACAEGYGYWQYGFGYFVYFADLLKARTAGAINLFAKDKVQSIAMFQQKVFLDDRFTVNFSDSPTQAGIFMGLGHYLHSVFASVDAPPCSLQAGYCDDHCSRLAPALRNLIWFNDKLEGKQWEPAAYYMSDAQWFVSRHVTNSGRFAFAAKGGHNNEPHNHNDVGQFILHVSGVNLICDIGSGLYTRDYFGPKRYDILCNASFGHSLPIINGNYQSAGAEHRATVLDATINQEIETFSIEMAAAYEDAELHELQRTFRWNKSERPVLELEDVYSFEVPPKSVVERFISKMKPKLKAEGVELRCVEQASLLIRFDAVQLEPSFIELAHTDHHGNPEVFYAIDMHIRQPESTMRVLLSFVVGE